VIIGLSGLPSTISLERELCDDPRIDFNLFHRTLEWMDVFNDGRKFNQQEVSYVVLLSFLLLLYIFLMLSSFPIIYASRTYQQPV
jgi:hypothetical protein